MKIGVYPGSFDPLTNGHIDILKRSLQVFDKVIVLIAHNPKKQSHFTIHQRLEMIKQSLKEYPNVEVDFTSGLTIEYAKKVHATHLIRGLRAVMDFEYEFQLAAANAFVDNEIDMIFFMSRSDTSFISSSNVMELLENGIDVKKLVPKPVYEFITNNKK